MGKKKVSIGLLTALLVISVSQAAWAGDSVTISMSLTIPSIPGVNAPARIPETVIQDYQKNDVLRNNSAATVGEDIIEKEESKVDLLAQGDNTAGVLKTIYTR